MTDPIDTSPEDAAAKAAFTEAYTEVGKMTPNGLLNSKPFDDGIGRGALGMNGRGEGHRETRTDGGIKCSVDVKSGFMAAVHSSFTRADVSCTGPDGAAIKNPLTPAETSAAIEAGRSQQPTAHRGNFSSRYTPVGRK